MIDDFVLGVGAGVFSVAFAMVAKTTPGEERTGKMAAFSASRLSGLLLGKESVFGVSIPLFWIRGLHANDHIGLSYRSLTMSVQ